MRILSHVLPWLHVQLRLIHAHTYSVPHVLPLLYVQERLPLDKSYGPTFGAEHAGVSTSAVMTKATIGNGAQVREPEMGACEGWFRISPWSAGRRKK